MSFFGLLPSIDCHAFAVKEARQIDGAVFKGTLQDIVEFILKILEFLSKPTVYRALHILTDIGF